MDLPQGGARARGAAAPAPHRQLRSQLSVAARTAFTLALLLLVGALALPARADTEDEIPEIVTDVTVDDASGELEPESDPEPLADEEVDLSALTFRERLGLLRPRVSLSQVFVVDSDFGGQEVDTYISRIRGSVSAPITQDFGVRLVAAGDLSVYDFDGDDDFIYSGRNSGEPWDELVSTVYRLEGVYRVFERWRLLGGGFLTSRFETGVRYGDGVEGGGFVGVGYRLNDAFRVDLGVALRSRMDQDGVGVSPLVRVEWQVTDDVEIQTEGLGVRVGTRVSDSLLLTLGTGFQGHRYRLGSRSGLIDPGDPTSGPVRQGSLRDRRLHVAAGLVWRPGQRWRLRGSLGLVPYQQYTTKDHRGNTLEKSTLDGVAFGSAIAVEVRF